MPRRTVNVPITFEGRDKGKVFRITEMPASQGERWGEKFVFALGRAGIQVPPDVMQSGFAGAAIYGAQSFISMNFGDARELLDEMFTCITIIPDPAGHPEMTRLLVEEDIEEISTRLFLRQEVLSLHLGFSVAVALSNFLTFIRGQMAAASRKAQTSQESLPQSS